VPMASARTVASWLYPNQSTDADPIQLLFPEVSVEPDGLYAVLPLACLLHLTECHINVPSVLPVERRATHHSSIITLRNNLQPVVS
jgi:hypothetical protein